MSHSLTILYGCHCSTLHSNHSDHSLFFVVKCSGGGGVDNIDLTRGCDSKDRFHCATGATRPGDAGNCIPCRPFEDVRGNDCVGKK